MSFIEKIISEIKLFESQIEELESNFLTKEAKSESKSKKNKNTEQISETKQELFIQITDNSVIDIIKYLSFSLLSGEYIKDENIINNLKIIENKVKEFPNKTNSLPNSLQAKIFEYTSGICMSIEGYIIFIRDIFNHYSDDRIDFLFSNNNQLEKILKESNLSNKIDSVTDYFFFLITLSKIDHLPSNENDYITFLFEVEKKIRNLDIKEYSSITKNVFTKINFLKHKWKSRKFHENPNSNFYLEDGIIKVIEDFNDENSKLKEWTEIIETQYELISRDWKHILESRVKNYKSETNFDKLKSLEIHQLIKYYKDVKPNYIKLVEIKKHLLKKIEQATNSYDKYVFQISYNYSLNNCFSEFLSNKNDFETVFREYSIIKDNRRGSVNNFFLEFKYLEFTTGFLLTKINDSDKIKYIEKYENIIENHCKNEVESYFEKKEWSKINHNYVFILPFEECLVPSSELDELKHIFYPSSFVLPPSLIKMEKDFEKIKKDFEKINLYINTGKYFKNEIQKIESLNSELDKKDFKSIEIISIFTAIITFVLSSIPAYKFINTVWESLLFMLSLASALGIFIILIFFTTRELHKNLKSYIPIVLLIIICLFGYKQLSENEKIKFSIDKSYNNKLDSISEKKIDSILKIKK